MENEVDKTQREIAEMSQSALDLFGHVLISKVRDEAISDWKMIVDGRMKGERAVLLRRKLDRFADEEREAFLSLVPDVVDSVLHHLLWTLEQHEEIKIGVSVEGNNIQSLNDVSDGLAGELYSNEGWIARFSKEK